MPQNTRRRRPTIRLQGWRDADGDSVCLQILDEGDGIPAADLERVFDKFHRAAKGDGCQRRHRAGPGVCRGFVEAMGGTITAGNRTDRSGAVFTITHARAAASPMEAAA